MYSTEKGGRQKEIFKQTQGVTERPVRDIFEISNFLMKQNVRDTGIDNGKVYGDLNWADGARQIRSEFYKFAIRLQEAGVGRIIKDEWRYPYLPLFQRFCPQGTRDISSWKHKVRSQQVSLCYLSRTSWAVYFCTVMVKAGLAVAHHPARAYQVSNSTDPTLPQLVLIRMSPT